MITRRIGILAIFIIGAMLIASLSGCSKTLRSLEVAKENRIYRKKRIAETEQLPFCQSESFPQKKSEITPEELKIDFGTMFIFMEKADLWDSTESSILEPSLQMLKTRGYNVVLGAVVDTEEDTLKKCRHCGEIVDESNRYFPFEKKYAVDNCLFTADDNNSFFKHLINEYPASKDFETCAYLNIKRDTGQYNTVTLDLTFYLFDNRKQTIILEAKVSENELKDVHLPPSGYSFAQLMNIKTEGILTTARRGSYKILSIFPNISGASIINENTPLLRSAYYYQYYIGNTPPKIVGEIKSEKKPTYWLYTYHK